MSNLRGFGTFEVFLPNSILTEWNSSLWSFSLCRPSHCTTRMLPCLHRKRRSRGIIHVLRSRFRCLLCLDSEHTVFPPISSLLHSSHGAMRILSGTRLKNQCSCLFTNPVLLACFNPYPLQCCPQRCSTQQLFISKMKSSFASKLS